MNNFIDTLFFRLQFVASFVFSAFSAIGIIVTIVREERHLVLQVICGIVVLAVMTGLAVSSFKNLKNKI